MPVIERANYGRNGSTDGSSGPVVNGVNVNGFCTCGAAGYCTESTVTPPPPNYCSNGNCNNGVCGSFLDVKAPIQAAIGDCQTTNPCDGPAAFSCTKAFCPSGPASGEYSFWANNALAGDPCRGTYKYMVFSWRCGVIPTLP
jgi:hypothetical protein